MLEIVGYMGVRGIPVSLTWLKDSIALENCYGLKSLKCRLQFKNKFIVLFIIIFGTLSFPIPELNSTARTAERWALYKQVR